VPFQNAHRFLNLSLVRVFMPTTNKYPLRTGVWKTTFFLEMGKSRPRPLYVS
jgi:hypothetical protein